MSAITSLSCTTFERESVVNGSRTAVTVYTLDDAANDALGLDAGALGELVEADRADDDPEQLAAANTAITIAPSRSTRQ